MTTSTLTLVTSIELIREGVRTRRGRDGALRDGVHAIHFVATLLEESVPVLM